MTKDDDKKLNKKIDSIDDLFGVKIDDPELSRELGKVHCLEPVIRLEEAFDVLQASPTNPLACHAPWVCKHMESIWRHQVAVDLAFGDAEAA